MQETRHSFSWLLRWTNSERDVALGKELVCGHGYGVEVAVRSKIQINS